MYKDFVNACKLCHKGISTQQTSQMVRVSMKNFTIVKWKCEVFDWSTILYDLKTIAIAISSRKSLLCYAIDFLFFLECHAMEKCHGTPIECIIYMLSHVHSFW